MKRTVGAVIECTIHESAQLVWSFAVAQGQVVDDETIRFTVDGEELGYEEVVATAGTRLHVLDDVPVGDFRLEYTATVSADADPEVPTPLDEILYRRPSRYCDSDTLAAVAWGEFQGLEGKDLLDAVTSWVGRHLTYVPGSSRPTDGSVQTYLSRQGVCRDYAHLVVALLRARNVPARLVSVYAPGLAPMDFHAVAEAYVDGAWQIVDATALAPRETMVRIATGRDASDTAFLTTQRGRLDLGRMTITAVADDGLPADDVTELVQLT